MTSRALVEMYNYWEKQATLYSKQPMRNVAPISVLVYFIPISINTLTVLPSNHNRICIIISNH